jgi:hypothetical protein
MLRSQSYVSGNLGYRVKYETVRKIYVRPIDYGVHRLEKAKSPMHVNAPVVTDSFLSSFTARIVMREEDEEWGISKFRSVYSNNAVDLIFVMAM